jgi:hypothetical protein
LPRARRARLRNSAATRAALRIVKSKISRLLLARALSCLGISATIDGVQDRTEINPTLYGVLDSDVGRNGARADAK